jgi:iron(III) transport system substrate-binding protein
MVKKLVSTLLILALVAGVVFAQASKETNALVIWSAAAEDEAQALIAKFNEKFPAIKVSVIRAGSGELLTRLNAEQPRPKGDILLGIAKESFDGAYQYFRGYKSVNHAAIGSNVRDTAPVPKYYGFSMPLQAFMINTKLLKPSEYPTSWADLINPKYKKEIILANPALSGSAYAQLYMVYKLYGDEFVKKLAKNATFTASSTVGPESVARGEYAITVTGEGNIAKYIGEGAPVIYIYPKDGTGARFDASGIIANGPNPKSAEIFMDFVTSMDAYKIILATRNRRVVVPELPGPKYLPALGEIKLFPYDAVEAAKIRESLSSKFSDWMH